MEEQIEEHYYDMRTKQEVVESQIKPDIPYILYKPNEKWKIRTIIFDRQGNRRDYYIDRQDVQKSVEGNLRTILQNRGYTDINIVHREDLQLDLNRLSLEAGGLSNYQITYKDGDGKTRQQYLEGESLKNIVRQDGNKTEVNIENRRIENLEIKGLLIGKRKTDRESEMNSKTGSTYKGRSLSGRGRVILNVDQFGFKGQYDLSTEEGIAKFERDWKEVIPKQPLQSNREK